MKRSSALWLTLFIFVVLVANSAEFFFHQAYYEVWDSAANSLAVIRAKHFEQLYGPYSRWHFQHPGPVLFYVQAFGEWLFYDLLHVVKSPFPGQTLAHLAVMCSFFVAALMIFANWLPAGGRRWWFLCGALAGGIAHFTLAGRIPSYDVVVGLTAFQSVWSGHALLLPFLCLLTAGASVGAGRGEDLPVMALASGYLLQLHVTEPMFVFPVFALAYAGLLWFLHGQREAVPGGGSTRLSPLGFLGAAWRKWPRIHRVTATILFFFAVPFLLDFSRGRHSNAAAIFTYLHGVHGPHKTWSQAWFFFLQFGAYEASTPQNNWFIPYDRENVVRYLREHAGAYALWGAVMLAAASALVAGWRGRGVTAPDAPAGPEGPGPAAGRRFRAWAAALLFLVAAVVLRWNVTQDGDMFYFNSWITFSLYYFAGLVALSVVCTLPWKAGSGSGVAVAPSLPSWREGAAGVCAVLAVAAWWSGEMRLRDPSPEKTRAFHEEVTRLITATRAAYQDGEPEAARLLVFDHDLAPLAAAMALRLVREDIPFVVDDEWQFLLGPHHRWWDVPAETTRPGRVQCWHLGHRDVLEAPAEHDTEQSLTVHDGLRVNLLHSEDIVARVYHRSIDPAAATGASIRLVHGGNSRAYAMRGWSRPEEWGTWTDKMHVMLEFHPVRVPDDDGTVEIQLLGINPLVDPRRSPQQQRLRVLLDDKPLGDEEPLTGPTASLVYRVPAAEWNRQTALPKSRRRLQLNLPDAISPHDLDPTHADPDMRQLGVGLQEIRFRFVPAAKVTSREQFEDQGEK